MTNTTELIEALGKIAEWLGDAVRARNEAYARYSPDYLNEGADALSDWG